MTITTLDAQTALIVVDLQNGIVAFTTTPPTHQVVEKTAILAEAFRHHGLPCVFVNVTGGAPGRVDQPRRATTLPDDWADLVPELNVRADEHRVTKKTWGAFTGTDLEAYLKGHGITQVVIAGIATSIGVESTARHAHELGFNVTIATDAVTDMNPDAHHNSLTRIFPRLGETGMVQEIIAHLP